MVSKIIESAQSGKLPAGFSLLGVMLSKEAPIPLVESYGTILHFRTRGDSARYSGSPFKIAV